jgi:alpha-beta hydrolase superfamily lysophospholipase
VRARVRALILRLILGMLRAAMRRFFFVLGLAGACAAPTGPASEPAIAEPRPGPAERTPAPAETPAPEAPAPELQRHTVQADGHPLAVWSRVPIDPHAAIVLVHGRTWSARPDFDLQVPGESRSLMQALAAEGFATYAVDLRGYGETPRDATGWLTPDRAAADLSVVLAWVRTRNPDLDPPAVLGWSMGSLVAQLTAQRDPDGMSAVVLYGYPRDPDARYPKDPGTREDPPKTATTAKAAAEDFIVPGAISEAGRDAFVAAALAADPVKADWRRGEQWSALDPAAVGVPTLVIHGERDPYAPVAAQAKLFARLGSSDRAWVIVAGGDHAAHLENCGPRFVAAVVGFLARPTP